MYMYVHSTSNYSHIMDMHLQACRRFFNPQSKVMWYVDMAWITNFKGFAPHDLQQHSSWEVPCITFGLLDQKTGSQCIEMHGSNFVFQQNLCRQYINNVIAIYLLPVLKLPQESILTGFILFLYINDLPAITDITSLSYNRNYIKHLNTHSCYIRSCNAYSLQLFCSVVKCHILFCIRLDHDTLKFGANVKLIKSSLLITNYEYYFLKDCVRTWLNLNSCMCSVQKLKIFLYLTIIHF